MHLEACEAIRCTIEKMIKIMKSNVQVFSKKNVFLIGWSDVLSSTSNFFFLARIWFKNSQKKGDWDTGSTIKKIWKIWETFPKKQTLAETSGFFRNKPRCYLALTVDLLNWNKIPGPRNCRLYFRPTSKENSWNRLNVFKKHSNQSINR